MRSLTQRCLYICTHIWKRCVLSVLRPLESYQQHHILYTYASTPINTHTYTGRDAQVQYDRISMDSGLACDATINFCHAYTQIPYKYTPKMQSECCFSFNGYCYCYCYLLWLLLLFRSKLWNVLSIWVLNASIYIHRTHFILRILASFLFVLSTLNI